MSGTEDQFNRLLADYYKITKTFEKRETNYVNYSQQMDTVFATYTGWTRKTFFKELNRRLGIHTNEKRKKAASAVAAKPDVKKSAKKDTIDF